MSDIVSAFYQFFVLCFSLFDEYQLIQRGVRHPKMLRLESILLEYFRNNSQHDAQAIVFCQYRSTVETIARFLSRSHPTVRPAKFIGQQHTASAKGQSQKEQISVIESFRRGEKNVLVATSIGEEGLDIGNVDLIVCFDVLTSPVRMIQRIGMFWVA